MALAMVPVALAVSAAAASRPQNDATEILDRAIEALGGESYLTIADVHATGRYYQFQRGQLSGTDVFEDYLQFPDKERTEFGEDRERIRINNGDRGWNITDGEVEAQLGEQIRLFQEEFKVGLDQLLRAAAAGSGVTLQYIGRETIDFSRVDVLELRDEDRTRVNLYVNRSTGVLLKKSVRRLDSPQVHEEVYSNYHQIQGVLTPLLVTRYTDGVKTMEIRFESVRYNQGLRTDLFVARADDEDRNENQSNEDQNNDD
jgi:hypothetical protein